MPEQQHLFDFDFRPVLSPMVRKTALQSELERWTM